MSTIIYRVFGRDTFSGEFFHVEDFKSREKAEAKVRECESSVLDQPESLRDSFWITESSQEEVDEENQRKEKERNALARRKFFDRKLLEINVKLTLKVLREELKKNHLSYNCSFEGKTEDALATIHNSYGDLTIHKRIILRAGSYDNGNSNINAEVFFDEGHANGAVHFFKSESEMLNWLDSPQSIVETIACIQELIDMYLGS